MSAHRILFDMLAAEYEVADPGDAGAIQFSQSPAIVPIVTAGSETRTLANPTKAGMFLLLAFKTDEGDCTVTTAAAYNDAGDTDIVFTAAGQSILLMSVPVGSGYRWRAFAASGVAVLADGAFDLNGEKLTIDADGDTSITADTDDQIDIEIAGADDFRFTANTFTALAGSVFAGALNYTAVARTASADGTGTGLIADAGMVQFVTVTAGGDANSIIVLPTPTPGTIVILHVGATGYELRTSAPATVAINGGAEADAESAIAANTTVVMICASATSWKGFQMGSDGTLAQVAAAAAA